MPKNDPLTRDLVRLALDLRRAAPWKRVAADVPILVRHAGDAHPLAVAVTAKPGMILARGEDALHDLAEWLGPRPPSPVGPQPDVVILGFEPRAKIPPELLRVVEAGGLQARHEVVVPKVLATDRSVRPRPLNRGQMRSTVAALRAVLIAEREGRLRPEPPAGSDSRILELALEGRGKRARVADRFVPRPEPRTRRAPPPAVAPPHDWAARLRDLPRIAETWIVGTMNWSASVAGEDRILVPLTVVDADSGLILASEIVTAGVVAELFAALAAVFRGEDPDPVEERFGLPRAIVFVDPWYRHTLGDALEAIGIEVSVERDHPVFVEVREGFGEMLARAVLDGEGEA